MLTQIKNITRKINDEQIKNFISYGIVGALATIVEWIFYWIFKNYFSVSYIIATVLAIVISTFSNWLFGRLITFRNAPKGNMLSEILKVYMASALGLLMNVLIMWILHGWFGMWDMLAKVIATGIVLIYNYLIRVLVIYKKK